MPDIGDVAYDTAIAGDAAADAAADAFVQPLNRNPVLALTQIEIAARRIAFVAAPGDRAVLARRQGEEDAAYQRRELARLQRVREAQHLHDPQRQARIARAWLRAVRCLFPPAEPDGDLILPPMPQVVAAFDAHLAPMYRRLPEGWAARLNVGDGVGLWIGVGVSSSITGPVMINTEIQQKVLDSIDLRNSEARGLMNPRFGVDNAQWLCAASALRTGAETVKKEASADWRLPALKVALYDAKREQIVTQP